MNFLQWINVRIPHRINHRTIWVSVQKASCFFSFFFFCTTCLFIPWHTRVWVRKKGGKKVKVKREETEKDGVKYFHFFFSYRIRNGDFDWRRWFHIRFICLCFVLFQYYLIFLIGFSIIHIYIFVSVDM